MWAGQDALADAVRLIVPDQRGFGASGGAPPASIEQLADDVVALLDALHVASRPSSAASRWVATWPSTWRRHPNACAAVVLVDTKLEADTPEARAARAELAAKVGRRRQEAWPRR